MAWQYNGETYTHKKYSRERLEEIYKNATRWQDLTYIPYLLTRWQKSHDKDILAVAGYCSCKLGKHKWCQGDNHLYFEPVEIPVQRQFDSL